MSKTKVHNEWFRPISLGNTKSCPSCKTKLEEQEKIWSWGEYIYGKFNCITHFCKNCFRRRVVSLILGHTDGCGCKIQINTMGNVKPDWLSLPEAEVC